MDRLLALLDDTSGFTVPLSGLAGANSCPLGRCVVTATKQKALAGHRLPRIDEAPRGWIERRKASTPKTVPFPEVPCPMGMGLAAIRPRASGRVENRVGRARREPIADARGVGHGRPTTRHRRCTRVTRLLPVFIPSCGAEPCWTSLDWKA